MDNFQWYCLCLAFSLAFNHMITSDMLPSVVIGWLLNRHLTILQSAHWYLGCKMSIFIPNCTHYNAGYKNEYVRMKPTAFIMCSDAPASENIIWWTLLFEKKYILFKSYSYIHSWCNSIHIKGLFMQDYIWQFTFLYQIYHPQWVKIDFLPYCHKLRLVAWWYQAIAWPNSDSS